MAVAETTHKIGNQKIMKFCISITSVTVLVSIAIGFTSPALGEVLCPGQAEGDYCDCQTDCSDNPSFCGCAEAQASECCAATPSPSPFVPRPEGAVLCPGQAESEFCNCETDCSEFPSYCACDEAQASECCAGTPDPETTPSPSFILPEGSVICPGAMEAEFCDCGFHCSDNVSLCSCAEAQASECCATTPDPETTPSPSYVSVSTSGVSVKKNTASIHFVGLGIVFSVVSAMIV